MTDKTIYELELHEEINLDKYRSVMIVPGGWIYKDWCEDIDSSSITATFVPYDREFDESTCNGW